jgi:threonine dehydratase
MNFLQRLGVKWNISLFHYRNHGADFGRVLVGMQIPTSESDDLQLFLQELDYSFSDETQNPAIGLFL